MRRSILLLCLSVVSIAVFGQRFAVSHVSVIPMNRDVVLSDQTVLVENGTIRKIGDANKVKIPAGATVIDGRGKYLTPGLMDMHAHFFYEQGEHRNTCETELKMMLATGMTTVRILAGHPVYLDARERVKTGNWAGPDLLIASPQFVGKWLWDEEPRNYEIVDTPEKAAAAVRRFKKEGYDAIKITFMVRRDAYDAIIRTAKEVGIKVTGHVGPLVRLPAALAAGQQIEHMDEFIDMLLPDTSYNHGQSVSDMNLWRMNAWATVPYLDEGKIPGLVKRVKQAGIYVTPTNFFFVSCFGTRPSDEVYKQRPDYAYIPAAILPEKWQIKEHNRKMNIPVESLKKYVDLRKKMTLELWRAGVPLMAGSDSPEWFQVQGFSLHDELEMFVECGLTPFAALQTATVNPAGYLGLQNRKGSIEKGKAAEFLLLDKNPLENIRNTRSISGVMKGARWYDQKAVEQLLEDAKILGR
ncbi:MAG TPA: amidohydrolase family protein [Flavilitoribacter sp.]|nr:amidohydrolase family protein [Flavilitoribacter sp.]